MKIALIAPHHLSKYQGGGEVYAHQIYHHLHSAHEVHYYSLFDENDSSKAHFARFSFKAIRQHNYDILHTVGIVSAIVLMRVVTPRARFIHSFLAPTHPKKLYKKILSRMYEASLPMNYDLITLLSTSQKSYFPRKYNHKLFVLPPSLNQIFLDSPSVKMTQAKKNLSLGNYRYLLLIASLDQHHYYKGVEVGLESLTYLPKNYQLIIIGKGNYKKYYQRLAQRLKVVHRVVWLDSVTITDLVQYYFASSLLLAPSTSASEGFGLTIIEALALARPVITTTKIGQAQELAKVGIKLIAPSNPKALASAILNAKKPSPAAITYARSHTSKSFQSQLASIYQKLSP